MLGRRRVIGPVILVDKQQASPRWQSVRAAGALRVFKGLDVFVEPRRRRLHHRKDDVRGSRPCRTRSATKPKPTVHHFVSAWALLARYQAIVRESPACRLVVGVQPSRTCFIRVTSRTFLIAPSGLSVFQTILPVYPVTSLIVSTSSRIDVPRPVPIFRGTFTS